MICAYIDRCRTFADIGCDHGYCTQYVLKNRLCDGAIISDVSAKSLNKAEKLLAPFIEKGVCRAVCCDGLREIPEDAEQVLIAGMGGEEIIKILSEGFIPRKFILQPMKNADKLRRYLIDRGCKIIADDIFKDNKFYFIIKGERSGGCASYTAQQLAFGRDSLKNPVFREYAAEELRKRSELLKTCGGSGTDKIMREMRFIAEAIE